FRNPSPDAGGAHPGRFKLQSERAAVLRFQRDQRRSAGHTSFGAPVLATDTLTEVFEPEDQLVSIPFFVGADVLSMLAQCLVLVSLGGPGIVWADTLDRIAVTVGKEVITESQIVLDLE